MRDEDTQNEAKLNLARRAVACPGWRWMPGMRYRGESWGAWGWVRVSERPEHIAALNERAGDDEELLPDLYDPATLGCIENALVPEAWGGDVFVSIDTHLTRDGRVRTVVIVDADGEPEPGEWAASTKAEALVLSLESAGRREVAP